ncbi:MAG: MATE family efflux transporter [Tannerellaceae bacterium]
MHLKTNGLRHKLQRLTWPIFFETLLIMMLGVVDTTMLSQYSDNSVAAVGVVNQLLTMIFILFNVTVTGTSVLCSQYFGSDDVKSFVKVMGVSILFNVVIGGVISLSLVFFSGTFLQWMDIRPDLMGEAKSYMEIVGGFAFLQALSLTVSAVMRSANRPKYAMYVTLLVNLLNIVGNYTLIFGKFGMPELGVTGAAMSTSFCRFVAMTVLFVVLFTRLVNNFSFSLFRPFPWEQLRNLLRIGIPAAGEQFSYCLSQVVIIYFINILGNEALAAQAYVRNIVIVGYLFSLSIAQGNAIIVGNMVGAGKKKVAYLMGLFCLKRTLIITAVVSVAVIVVAKPILGFFTHNPEIITIAFAAIIVDAFLEQGRAAVLIFLLGLRSAGDVIFPVVLGLFSMWFFAVFVGHTLGITWGLGLAGMWAAFAMDECFRGAMLMIRWKSKRWMKRRSYSSAG